MGKMLELHGEEIKLNRHDLTTIMVYHNCFLLELLILKDNDRSSLLPQQQLVSMSDFGAKVGEIEAVLSDLTLVENHIPFLILNKIHDFNVKLSYKNGLLLILHLRITETTEPKWHSFIVWEHHRNTSKRVHFDNHGESQESGKSSEIDDIEFANVFTFLSLLFNDVICCVKDVQLFKHKGTIKDELGMSNHDLVTLFCSITNSVDHGRVDSTYANIVDALNTYLTTNLVAHVPIIACHYLS
ncbi:hypothetical protein VNO78_28852 [Psophocarpus tetragonolobus]|uniref:Uncharacterized protein n=1 Tax=Psophocarpus tetragonolobus TaxID=3891 RepID=A0AAN9RTW4_PSOTE